MHFYFIHNKLRDIKLLGFVAINILQGWGVKVVNMDWF